MAKSTGKVREFCQSKKVGTLLVQKSITNVVQKRYSFFSRFPAFFPTSGHVDCGTGQVVVTRHDKRASERASLRCHQPRRDAGRNSV